MSPDILYIAHSCTTIFNSQWNEESKLQLVFFPAKEATAKTKIGKFSLALSPNDHGYWMNYSINSELCYKNTAEWLNVNNSYFDLCYKSNLCD